MVCDADAYYMCNAMTYLGKEKDAKRQPSIAQKVALELMEPYLDPGHVVTMDNWFTLLPLLRELQERGTTIFGTLRNKAFVPTWMVTKEKTRPINTSSFLFQEEVTLLSYKP